MRAKKKSEAFSVSAQKSEAVSVLALLPLSRFRAELWRPGAMGRRIATKSGDQEENQETKPAAVEKKGRRTAVKTAAKPKKSKSEESAGGPR